MIYSWEVEGFVKKQKRERVWSKIKEDTKKWTHYLASNLHNVVLWNYAKCHCSTIILNSNKVRKENLCQCFGKFGKLSEKQPWRNFFLLIGTPPWISSKWFSEFCRVVTLLFEAAWLMLQPSRCKSSHPRCSVRKGVFRNFAKFTGKHLCQSLFLNKVAFLLKKRLWHRCFSVNFAKFVRASFYKTPLDD